jgi:hypothetical protein
VKAKEKDTEISVMEVHRGKLDVLIVGNTPLIYNRMSFKVKAELLLPKLKKNAAEKASTLKHEPLAEFNDSAYKDFHDTNETLLVFPATAFKQAMSHAALDLPGANKSQIGRLTSVDGHNVNIYGRPFLLMQVVRSADMNRTPDVRTRAIVPEWCCRITATYTKPIIKEQAVANLLAAAGMNVGIGDYRVQKGAGSYGQFRLVSADDKDFKRISKIARAEQIKAMKEHEPYDDETRELLSWFDVESKRRGFKVAA